MQYANSAKEGSVSVVHCFSWRRKCKCKTLFLLDSEV